MAITKDAFSVWQRLIAAASIAGLTLTTLSAPVAAQTKQVSYNRQPSSPARHSELPMLKIASPKNGAVLKGESIKLSIEVGSSLDIDTLKVIVNGKVLRSSLPSPSCTAVLCTVSTTLSDADGLKDGDNAVRVDVVGKQRGQIDTRTSRFKFDETGLLGDAQSVNYSPLSLGISTAENGGNGKPWVTITTGQPAGVTDPVQNYPSLTDSNGNPVSTSLPYQDATFSTECSGSIYQAIVLDRGTPTSELASACANSFPDIEANLETSLGRSLSAKDLIIFGTTPYSFAWPGLDTSDIGGTNWTNATASAPDEYPTYYIIAGVKGAAPGTAHENSLWGSNLNPNSDTPYQWGAFLRGSLHRDANSQLYNYIPGDESQFQAVSGATAHITVGSTTYTPPPGKNGFWLLVLDPVWLQPITNYSALSANSTISTGTCPFGGGNTSCGYFIPTYADESAPAGATQALAQTLSSISPQNLIFLVTEGCPFQGNDESAQVTAGKVGATGSTGQTVLAAALDPIGGMAHSVTFMDDSDGGCNYALVTKRDGKHGRFGSHSALSWNYQSAQGQLGALHGNLAKGNDGFFDVAGQDQMVMSNNNTLATTDDYTFENLASSVRTDWPFSSTTGELAAYHDISNQLLTDKSINEHGSNNYDLRIFYTDQNNMMGKLDNLIDSRLDPATATNPVSQSGWDTATTDEFSNVRNELMNEILDATRVQDYLTGENGNGGVRGILSTQGNSVMSNAIEVANDVGLDATVANSTKTDISGAVSDWMNLAAGALSIVSAAVGPEGPAAIGILSGALWTGSAAGTPLVPTETATQNPQVIAGPATTYDTTLADITQNASVYSNHLLLGYDAATDAILTDSSKVATAGSLVTDSDSGWRIPSVETIDQMSAALSSGAKTSLWLGELTKLYGIRYATAMTTNQPTKLGVYAERIDQDSCVTEYHNVQQGSWVSYSNLSDPALSDLAIMAENPVWTQPDDGEIHYDLTVSSNLANFLTTNQVIQWTPSRQETGINIAPMQLFTDGPMDYSLYAQVKPNNGTCTDPQN